MAWSPGLACGVVKRSLRRREGEQSACWAQSWSEAVVQDDGSRPGPGGAVRRQPVVCAPERWELRDLGFPAEQDLPDQLELGVPTFGFPGVVHAGELDEVGDRLGAAAVVG